MAPFLSELGVLATNSPFRLFEVYNSEKAASITLGALTAVFQSIQSRNSDLNSGRPYCPAPLSILLATLTPLSPFTYLAMPR